MNTYIVYMSVHVCVFSMLNQNVNICEHVRI